MQDLKPQAAEYLAVCTGLSLPISAAAINVARGPTRLDEMLRGKTILELESERQVHGGRTSVSGVQCVLPGCRGGASAPEGGGLVAEAGQGTGAQRDGGGAWGGSKQLGLAPSGPCFAL